MIIMVLKLFFLVFTLYMPFIEMQEPQRDIHTTVETIIVETTTEVFVPIITDIPQSDVEIAMNHDYGRYTTMVFNYVNSQYDNLKKRERCYDEYIKCLITQGVATPVCAVNDPRAKYIQSGFNTFNSYCEAYFDNCLRRMRFWRILDTGRCNFSIPGVDFNITPYRRYLAYLAKKNILT